jgi:hypothetical protein
MRSVRMILGLVAAVCAFGVLTSPALAEKKIKEPVELGKFKATVSGNVKGIGEAGEMHIGPYSFPNGCSKELKAKGMVEAGESTTIALGVKFAKCVAKRKLGGGIEEPVTVHFTLGMEFHSNGFVEFGESNGGVKISKASVSFKGSKSNCVVEIPAQTVPTSAEKNPEKEFEAVSYGTEKEKLFSKGQIEKFGEFRERLFIEWELKAIDANVKITPKCEYKKGEEGKFNPETGDVEFDAGKMEGELEEITLKNGNLSFIPKV